MLSVRTILCPLDLRESSFIALAHAVKWASFFGSDLLIVHVIDFLHPSLEGEDVLFPDVEERSQRVLTENESKLQQLVDKRGVPIPPTRLFIRFGDPATTIADIARKEAADLIILGRYKPGSQETFFTASTLEQVLLQSSCAVLTIPLPGEEIDTTCEASSARLDRYVSH